MENPYEPLAASPTPPPPTLPVGGEQLLSQSEEEEVDPLDLRVQAIQPAVTLTPTELSGVHEEEVSNEELKMPFGVKVLMYIIGAVEIILGLVLFEPLSSALEHHAAGSAGVVAFLSLLLPYSLLVGLATISQALFFHRSFIKWWIFLNWIFFAGFTAFLVCWIVFFFKPTITS